MTLKFFNKFDPLKQEEVAILDQNGKVIATDLEPNLSKEVLLRGYKLMKLSRIQDFWQNKYQRQGRLLSFLTSTGQEAAEVAYGMQLKRGVDWMSVAYRNNAAWLAAGVPMSNIMLYWMGNERGSVMPDGVNVTPVNIPIASQCSHAVGIAFAEKFLGRSGLAVTSIGDGGTSEGEFYEAMNFGKLHEVPVLFCVEDNKYAISTPSSKSTKAINYAVKGHAAGVPSILVDGNDFLACYAVVEEAYQKIRDGSGPLLIVFNTYRMGAHSSSDDPSVYRSRKEEEEQFKRDPLIRMKIYLINKKYWSDEEEKELDQQYKKQVQTCFKATEKNNKITIAELFEHTYRDLTPNLQAQLAEVKTRFPEDE